MRNARAALAALILLAAAFAPGVIGAEETRTVAGYQFAVGFRDEPAYVEQPNAVLLRLADSAGRPVAGAHETLKVEIGVLGRKQTLDFRPVRDRPDTYEAVFIPPHSGEYTLRFFGRIDGTPIEETFVSGRNGIGKVITRSSNDYSSWGAYFAFGLLGAYLVGLVVIYVVRRQRRPALTS